MLDIPTDAGHYFFIASYMSNEIRIVPGHIQRNWQSCEYYRGDIHLFHERTFVRLLPRTGSIPRNRTPAERYWSLGGPELSDSVQWFDGLVTLEQAKEICERHKELGLEYEEDHYPPEDAPMMYFLTTHSNDNAMKFIETEDFKTHCLTMEKV